MTLIVVISYKCPHCPLAIETISHFWECPLTLSLIDNVLHATYLNFYKVIPQDHFWQHTYWPGELISRNMFLAAPLHPMFKGFVLQSDQLSLFTVLEESLGISRYLSNFIHYQFLDCFLASFYTIVWLPRAKLLSIAINLAAKRKKKKAR